jgi:hypothetical protein
MKKAAALLILATMVEIASIYLVAWAQTGSPDPRCALIPGYVIVNHVIGNDQQERKCEPEPHF